MKEYLKSYHMIMTAIGPVFIGSGKEIGKKEYVFLFDGKLGIVNIEKFYTAMQKRGLGKSFEEYILSNSRDDLKRWLFNQKINTKDIADCMKYVLNNEDVLVEKGTKLQILEFVKDNYQMPYIPGSSIKGMLRTILLSSDILKQNHKYSRQKESIDRTLNSYAKTNRNSFLRKEANDTEAIYYNLLAKNEKKKQDAVNDIMSGMVISDSKPLDLSDLTICQRIERHIDGAEKKLNVLRECIKPGTEIEFDITIDTTLCNIGIEDIMAAVNEFHNMYYDCFLSKFKGIDRPVSDTVFLGGGVGFASKTVVYPMFGYKKGLEVTKKIFEKTKVPLKHGHNKDTALGASPHIIKCTHYKGQTMQMGMCRLRCEK